MKIAAIALFVAAVGASAQIPPPLGAYIFSGGVWGPAPTTSVSNPLDNPPPPAALYCKNVAGQWVPADSSCFGGGSGSGTVNSGTTGQVAYYPSNGTAVSGLTLYSSLTASFSAGGNPLNDSLACSLARQTGTISQITAMTDGSVGNGTMDIKTESLSAFLAGTAPTSITNGNAPSFSSARGVQTTSFTGWSSTTVTAGNVYCVSLQSPTVITGLSVQILFY